VNFDSDVRIGQVRVFADAPEPLVALVVAVREPAGYRIVPVSPFRVPASEAELVVGERVFQLWNACTAAKRFVERGWVADELSDEDVRRVCDGVAAVRLTRFGDYERRHLAMGGDFRPWSSRCLRTGDGEGVVVPHAFWRRYGVWSAAAMIVLGLGVAWLVGREPAPQAPSSHVITLQMVRPEPVAELAAEEAEPPPSVGPMPEVAVEVAVETPSVVPPAPAPEVRELVRAPEMKPPVPAQLTPLDRDYVVAARLQAGEREREVVRKLGWLKATQREDGSWGERPLKDTALAVLALMAHGETSDSKEYGPTLVKGVRYLMETSSAGLPRLERQTVACALCCASVAVRNPNVRPAAERALAAVGDHRSVEAGRDWKGLLDDLMPPAPKESSREFRLSDRPLEEDATAAAGIFVLQLLK